MRWEGYDKLVESIENLIRRKRHGANWLLLVDPKVIKFSDVKILHTMDKTALTSTILTRAFEGSPKPFYSLRIGEAHISADKSSVGEFTPILVSVRPRITLHGAPTKTAL